MRLTCFISPLPLQVWRQSDAEFVSILNDIRHDHGGDALHKLVARCSRPLPNRGDGIKPTQVLARCMPRLAAAAGDGMEGSS